MFVLELVNKDSEGTWSNNICVSNDKEKLKQRATIEKEKTIADNPYHKGAAHLFKIGELDDFIQILLQEARDNFVDNEYYMDGTKVGSYKDLKTYMETKAQPMAQLLGIDSMTVADVVNQGFYESLKFQIREIEQI